MASVIVYHRRRIVALEADGRTVPTESLVVDERKLARLLSRDDLEVLEVRKNFIFKFPAPSVIAPVAGVPEADNWGCLQMAAPQLNAATLDGRGIKVGIIDSGLDLTHPCFANLNLKAFVDINFDNGKVESKPPYDAQSHGTFCTAILAGGQVNGFWRGMAPRVELYVCKVFNQFWETSAVAFHNAFQFLINNDVKIISVSMGLLEQDNVWAPKIKEYLAKGGILFAGVGNFFDSNAPTISPANYPFAGLCAVGAHNSAGSVWSKSGGAEVLWPAGSMEVKPLTVVKPDLVAPGTAILSVAKGGELMLGEGTSYATPHVAGLAACIWSGQPKLSGMEVLDIITHHLKDLGSPGQDTRYGKGLIDGPGIANAVLD